MFGYDVRREPSASLIGVTGQYATVDDRLTATKNLIILPPARAHP